MDYLKKHTIRPVVITVGNELVYGERNDTNKAWMFSYLYRVGMPAEIGMTLPDNEREIGQWIRVFKEKGMAPIFVSGGIGGTHDDRTRQGIALGLNRKLVCHKECYEILKRKYGKFFYGQRERMAWLPEGCSLIPNDIGAPGFYLEDVYAFPGFPEMLQPMFRWVMDNLFDSIIKDHLNTYEWTFSVSEGVIGSLVEEFCKTHPSVSIGLYPHIEGNGPKVTVRFRCKPEDSHLASTFEKLLKEFLASRNVKAQRS